MIHGFEKDPGSTGRIRAALNGTAKDLLLLEEVLAYLGESVSADRSITARPADEAGARLLAVLRVLPMHEDLRVRIEDMRKIVAGHRDETASLQAPQPPAPPPLPFPLPAVAHLTHAIAAAFVRRWRTW